MQYTVQHRTSAIMFPQLSTRQSSLLICCLMEETRSLPCQKHHRIKYCNGENIRQHSDDNICQLSKQGIHRYQTPPRYRNALPCGPLRPNVTSSIKLEVHNVSQRRQRRTEPQPQGICTHNFVKIGPAVPEICSWTDRHTNRQTDKLMAILCSRTGAE